MFGLSVMFGNVVCFVSVFRPSFVFSKSHVQVSTSLTNISGLAAGTINLVNCAFSVVWLFFVFYISICRKVAIGLCATRML